MSLTVYGASDDLIEVEGDIREEFTANDDLNYIACSDGTVLSITYDQDGFWRIRCLWAWPRSDGSPAVTIEDGRDPDTDYSDRATVHGDIKWVVHGTRYERVRGAS